VCVCAWLLVHGLWVCSLQFVVYGLWFMACGLLVGSMFVACLWVNSLWLSVCGYQFVLHLFLS